MSAARPACGRSSSKPLNAGLYSTRLNFNFKRLRRCILVDTSHPSCIHHSGFEGYFSSISDVFAKWIALLVTCCRSRNVRTRSHNVHGNTDWQKNSFCLTPCRPVFACTETRLESSSKSQQALVTPSTSSCCRFRAVAIRSQ